MHKRDIDWYLTRRCRALNAEALRHTGVDYVLCWLQQTLRADSNPVIDAALAFGRLTAKPVVVYHGLGQHYPHASDRLHQFILEASQSLEAGLDRRQIRFLRYVETQDNVIPGLLYQLAARASVVVVDDQAAFVGRWQAERVAKRLDRLVVAVDGMRLIPEGALKSELRATVQFRDRHTQLRERWLTEPHDLKTDHSLYSGELPVASTPLERHCGQSISTLIERCQIDHSVPPVSWCTGNRDTALTHLSWALSGQIPGYSANRNNPAQRSTSYLSPYLHFGVLWPGDIAPLVLESDASSQDQWKYLDELLTWREYFHHKACHASDPTSYDNLPSHARQTLQAHAGDTREHLYSLDELIHSQTHDEVWNVAQQQFLLDGWMHNNLRMYWSKKLLAWTPSPQAAWQTACYLNDRLSLDGRDPATYGNLAWCFGSARPAEEVSVYGTVARKSDRVIRARPGVLQWLASEQRRETYRVSVPHAIEPETKPQASGHNTTTPE